MKRFTSKKGNLGIELALKRALNEVTLLAKKILDDFNLSENKTVRIFLASKILSVRIVYNRVKQ